MPKSWHQRGIYFLLWLYAVQLYFHVFAKGFITSSSGSLISHFPDHTLYKFLSSSINSAGTAEAGLDYLSVGCPLLSVVHHLLGRSGGRTQPPSYIHFSWSWLWWQSVSSCHGCSVLSKAARLCEWKQMQCVQPGVAIKRAPSLPGRKHLVPLLGQV